MAVNDKTARTTLVGRMLILPRIRIGILPFPALCCICLSASCLQCKQNGTISVSDAPKRNDGHHTDVKLHNATFINLFFPSSKQQLTVKENVSFSLVLILSGNVKLRPVINLRNNIQIKFPMRHTRLSKISTELCTYGTDSQLTPNELQLK